MTSTAGPDRVALITDAMAAAGLGDGTYRLGEMDVDVDAGVAHIAGTDTLAGSTTTMDRCSATPWAERPTDDALLRAVRQTAANPARVLGRTDIGALEPGRRADLVVLDADLQRGRRRRRRPPRRLRARRQRRARR